MNKHDIISAPRSFDKIGNLVSSLSTTAGRTEACGGPRTDIRHVIVKGDATTVVWGDGRETSVTCQGGDIFDVEKAVMACFVKRLHGNTGRYNKVLAEATDPVNGKLVIHSVKQA